MTAARAICLLEHAEPNGQVLRWYPDLEAAEHGDALASANRRGATFYRTEVPAHVRDSAAAAHRELHGDRHADVRHYVTHVRVDGQLVPRDEAR